LVVEPGDRLDEVLPPPPAPPPRRGRWLRRIGGLLLLPLTFYLGVLFEFHAGPDINQVISPALFAGEVKGLDTGTLNQIYQIIQANYPRTGFSSNDVFNAAAKGEVHNLLGAQPYQDNFSVYFTPDELKQNQDFLNGSFGGIGATMASTNNQLMVVSILPGTPAQAAGLKVADVVTKIDGKDATGLTVDQAVQKIRGPVGTHVVLTVSRAGKTSNLDIVRALISVPSVRSKDITPGVLYIRIYEFGEHTADDFQTQLSDGIKRGDNRVVLDLRGNPGGFVTAADSVVSQFVSSGLTVTVAERSGRTDHKVTGQGVAFNPKLVVLVDENSASASEIVAGALQDHHRGPLVGNKTFGKGLVEQDFPLRNKGDLHLTIAYWYRPSGKSINLVGITPDQTVALAHPSDFYEVDQPVGQPGSDPGKDAQLQAGLAAFQ
jgi:carboxyl-terminal processing protease